MSEIKVLKPIKQRDGAITGYQELSVPAELANEQLSKPDSARNPHWRGVLTVEQAEQKKKADKAVILESLSEDELTKRLEALQTKKKKQVTGGEVNNG